MHTTADPGDLPSTVGLAGVYAVSKEMLTACLY